METTTQWPDPINEEKRELLLQLIYANSQSSAEREDWLCELESACESDADEIMQRLLGKQNYPI